MKTYKMSKAESFKLTEVDNLFDQLQAASLLPSTGLIENFRKESLKRFSSLGMPTLKHEEWRFTNVSALAHAEFGTSVYPDSNAEDIMQAAEDYGLLKLTSIRFVFVNGHFRSDLSDTADLPATITVKNLADDGLSDASVQDYIGKIAVDQRHPFMALNNALFSDGLIIHVPANTIVTAPIHIMFLTTESDVPLITNPRLLVVAEASSQITIMESYMGPEEVPYFTNSVAEFEVAENAVVDHYRLNLEGGAAFHMATLDAHQGRTSNFSTQSVTFGGHISRNDVGLRLDGQGAFGVMNGLYQISGSQMVDNHTRIDHAQPNCETHELFKGVLDDKARGVFNGMIMVRQIAQKTDAKQTNRTLLLSPNATINTNPQLEIFADDVKCTHGATIGQIDRGQLYYLKSRGISAEAARRMLVFAFANDVVERIKIAPLRELLENRLLESHGVSEALAKVH
jgi:Fe-S cluster assembly protein SufD